MLLSLIKVLLHFGNWVFLFIFYVAMFSFLSLFFLTPYENLIIYNDKNEKFM
jgi:hypothetical protein